MPIRRSVVLAATAALTVTGLGATTGTAAAAPPAGSPLGSYIVTLDGSAVPAQVAARAEHQFGGRTEHVYTAALKGFAVRLPEAVAARLSTLPGVVAVEADQPVQADTTETNATWGLDRIDQHSLPLSTTYNYTADGTGVTAYIIDTGIRLDHGDFGGRATSGVDEVDGGAPTTATATGPTSRARSAARRTASPRRSPSWPCACWTARALAATPA